VLLQQIATLAAEHHLAVLGGFAAEPGDQLPDDTASLVLLGPLEPGFWPHVTAQPEFDGTPDPVDRWSRRALSELGNRLGAQALFPFGTPHHPFHRWALRSGRCWSSPVRLLVHDQAGLMVSFRGALAFADPVPLPAPPPAPCDSCTGKPCLAACPAAALTARGYDVPACHAFLDQPDGSNCITGGCLVRRACPVSQRYARLPEQSAYHMRQFHR
jgi:epoxyqueuosine reductase